MPHVPPEALARANAQSQALRQLVRAPEILVMPGAYDALSARLFQHLGFKAIQGSSGAIAASLGYRDGEVVSRDTMIEVMQRIVEAVTLPVNADGEKGYADAAHIGETVHALIDVGCAGMNLEDSAPHKPGEPATLVPLDRHLEKVRALLEARRNLGSEFFLNARVDAFLAIQDDPTAALREGVKRGQACAEAGADCIFFMRVPTRDAIRTLVQEIPAPVSILAGPATPSVAELQELGVARVSYGSAFASVAAGAIRRLAMEVMESGTITAVKDGIPREELAAVLRH